MKLRYRLIRASLTSTVTALPPRLVRELVIRGFWTAEQALHRVERMGDLGLQARALLLLVPDLPKRLHHDVLALAAGYGDEDRARVLDVIIPLLNDELVPPAIELTLDSETGLPLPGPLVALAARLPRDDWKRLANHPLLTDERRRIYVRAAVTLFLTRDRATGAQAVLRRVRALHLGVNEGKGELVAALLPHMPDESFDDVLALLDGAEIDECEALMSALGGHVPMNRLDRLLTVLDFDPASRRSVDRPWSWWAFLLSLTARIELSRTRVAALLDLALQLFMDPRDAEVLAALVRRLSTTEVRRWLNTIFPSHRAEGWQLDTGALPLLGALLRRLPPEEARPYAEAAALPLPEFPWDWGNRAHLMEYLPPEARRPYLIEVSRQWRTVHLHSETFTLVGPHLSEEELEGLLDAMGGENAPDADTWLELLDALAPHLPDHLLLEAVSRTIPRPETERFTALAELVRLLRPGARGRFEQRSLMLVQDTPDQRSWADSVRKLAPALSQDAAVAALEILTTVSMYGGCAQAVEALSASLPSEALPQAWSVAVRGSEDRPEQPAFQAPSLMTRLASAGHGEIIDAVLASAAEHVSQWLEDEVARFLTTFVPLLSAEQLRHATDAFLSHRSRSPRWAESVAGLSRHLPETERQKVTDAVLTALADARHETNNWDPRPMTRALGHLYRAGATEAVTDALGSLVTASTPAGWGLSIALVGFGTALPAPVVEDALTKALTNRNELDLFDVPFTLASSLNEDQVRRVLREVVDLEPPSGLSFQLLTALAESLGPGAGDAVSRKAFEHACRAGDLSLSSYGEHFRTLLHQLRRFNAPEYRVLVGRIIDHHSPSAAASWAPDWDFDSAVVGLEAEELAELYARITHIRNPTSRATAQATILRRLGAEWPGAAFPGTGDLVHTWPVHLDRTVLCTLLAASAWWVYQRGGAEAVDGVVDALIDVCTWWP